MTDTSKNRWLNMTPEEFAIEYPKALRSRGGDTSWTKNLPPLDPIPTEGEETVAIFVPKRKK